MLRFLALAFVSQALVVNHSATRTAASNMTTPANDTVVVPAPASNSTPSNSSVVVPTPASNSTPPSNSTNAPKAPVAVSPPVNGSSGSNSTNSTVPTNSSSPKSNSSNPVPVPVPVIAPKAAEPTSAYKIVYSNFTSEPTMNQKNRLRGEHAKIAEVPDSQVDVESSSYTVRALAYSVTVTMRNTKVEPTLLATRAQALASSPDFKSEFPYVTQSAVQSTTAPSEASLSGSAIAAIVICSIIGALLIAAVVAFLVHRYVLRGGKVSGPKSTSHYDKEGHHHHQAVA